MTAALPPESVRLKHFAIFASGTGSNFRRFLQASAAGELPGLLPVVLICDKPCGAAEIAREHRFPCHVLIPREFPDKAAYEAAVLEALAPYAVDCIALAGYMRLVGPALLTAYRGRILNLHPSLLPLYPGKDSIARAYRDGVKRSGVSVHLVDEGLDSGPLLAQEEVPLLPGMSLEAFEAAIHAKEHQLYPRTLLRFAQRDFKK